MAIEQILPYDWSVNISTSSHTNIYDYANALTNVDSTTHGSYTAFSSTPSSYLLFRVSDLPQSITSAQFKIKARITSAMPCSICSTVQYNGTTYNSDAITATAQTATLYDIQLPRGVSLSNLKNASAIYITITPSSGAGLYVFGTELNIDTTVYKIFNLILPGKANYPEPVSPTQEYTISKYPASYTTSGSISGTKYRNAIGKGADTAAVSGNDYASSSGSLAYINYAFDFSEIPDNAVIKSMSVSVKGHRESTSQGTAAFVVYHTGTKHNYSTVTSFTSTSAEVLEMDIRELPTRQDLQQTVLSFTIGYYGGLVNGATWTVTYEA